MFRPLRDPDLIAMITQEVPHVAPSMTLALRLLAEADGAEQLSLMIGMGHFRVTRAREYFQEESHFGVTVRADGEQLAIALLPPTPKRGRRATGPAQRVTPAEFPKAVLAMLRVSSGAG